MSKESVIIKMRQGADPAADRTVTGDGYAEAGPR